MVVTPQFKYFITFLNTDKFFLFYQIQLFLYLLNKQQTFSPYLRFFEINFLFEKNIFKYFIRNLMIAKTNYVGNFKKSLIAANLNSFNNFLSSNANLKSENFIQEFLLYNIYALPLKTANFVINKKFYENVLFMQMFLDLNMWSNYSQFFKIYLNFLLIHFNFQIYIFYNGFFCNIYNY